MFSGDKGGVRVNWKVEVSRGGRETGRKEMLVMFKSTEELTVEV